MLVSDQVSITSTFYEQLLLGQVPKAEKDIYDLSVFWNFWDVGELKQLVNMLVKSTPGVSSTLPADHMWAFRCICEAHTHLKN